MERTTIDLWVGIFMVVGLGALTVLALKEIGRASCRERVSPYV